MDNNQRVYVSQLPEKYSILAEDYLLIEDMVDTYKVKGSVLLEYINNYIEEADQKITDILGGLKELETTIKENEEQRELNETNRENKFSEYESLSSKIENAVSLIEELKSEGEQRNQEFTQIKSFINTVNEAEEIRIQNETDRQNAETARQEAEAIRVQNEIDRQNAEVSRSEAEDDRILAEQARENAETERANTFVDMKNFIDNFKNEAYPISSFPIGSIYFSDNDTNPNTTLGGGTWELIIAIKLSTIEVPDDESSESITTNPPYMYIWRRTA